MFILEKVCGIFHLSIIVEYSTVDLKKKRKKKGIFNNVPMFSGNATYTLYGWSKAQRVSPKVQ